jgi:HEXXH motif-containing protein
MKFIQAARGAALAVSSVLSAVHVLRPKAPDYDVSYSEPALPFSVFAGIDPRPRIDSHLRLAECILHECMHLQLTLIEEVISLIATGDEHHHSPWRQTLRPTRGVLHALYVFRVIQEFFSVALTSTNLSGDERRHARHRINEIESEVAQVGDLSASHDLTPAGRAIVTRLQIGNRLAG